MDMAWIRCAQSLCWGSMTAGALMIATGCTAGRGDEVESLSGSGSSGQMSSTSDGSTTAIDPTVDEPSTGNVNGCQSDAECVEAELGNFCELATGFCFEECAPESTRPCYSGAEGSEGIGACQAGAQTCNTMGRWTLDCVGEVIPASNDCDDNGADDDCDGLVDDTDADGDGFGACLGGDCCDISGGACSDAELVNPGAYEFVGNDFDDDCDGEVDEETDTCDSNISSNTSDAVEFANALDLCTVTEENPANPADRTWGVIDASLTMADGTGSPIDVQHSVRRDFGDLIEPEGGSSLVVLSTGHAADEADVNPDFAAFQGGVDLETESGAPADWLEANGGTFPNPNNCLEPWDADANDSVMLTLRVRAPTNAQSFSVRMNFFSAEYPEWVCSEFNDFFVALVDPEVEGNPEDGNIAIYDDRKTTWPVGVNLVMIADGLFSQCENGEVGCRSDLGSNYAGCVGNALLAGTGFDLAESACSEGQTQAGGATGWLKMSGNVTPGAIFEVRFAIWDTSGHIFDSLVLLDDWEWSVDAATAGVVPG